jgi:hypothetical protein
VNLAQRRPPRKAAATKARGTQEHNQEWLCHKTQEGAEPFGKLRINEPGPYKNSLEYGDLGGVVECVKAAAELPHSKGDGV